MLKPEEKAYCPYNKAHTFAKEKFIFHISRCKDRLKVDHMFKTCKYNPIHIVPNDDIELHECSCPNRDQTIKLMLKLRKTFKITSQQRQRSRERRERQQNITKEEADVKVEKCQEETFSQCEQCKELLKQFAEEIKNETNPKLTKFILKYYSLSNSQT